MGMGHGSEVIKWRFERCDSRCEDFAFKNGVLGRGFKDVDGNVVWIWEG